MATSVDILEESQNEAVLATPNTEFCDQNLADVRSELGFSHDPEGGSSINIPCEFRNRLRNNRKHCLEDLPLTPENYTNYFWKLLWAEEFDLEATYDVHTICNTTFTRREFSHLYHQIFSLELPMYPGSPLSIGDRVVFLPVGSGQVEIEKCRTGIIMLIGTCKVSLTVTKSTVYDLCRSGPFHVVYYPNRFSRYISLLSVKEAVSNPQYRPLIFPQQSSDESYVSPPKKVSWKSMENDPMQVQAVEHIVAKSSLPCPYLLFGPPGTGKTSTVVQAIIEVLNHDKKSKVLVCTPSNYASNLIAEFLMKKLPRRILLRFFSGQRHGIDELSEEMKLVSNIIKKRSKGKLVERFGDVDSCDVASKKVIICTLLKAESFRKTDSIKFSHIFVDEAGMATEPQTIVAFIGNLAPDGLVVLAGDHKQLRPVVTSPFVQGYGQNKPALDMSLFERLMALPMYGGTGEFNKKYVTMLETNRRSHPDISQVSSYLFYSDRIKTGTDPLIANKFLGCDLLPTLGFPLVFQETAGCEQIKQGSHSYYNIKEASAVAAWVGKLLPHTTDIGIITPYSGQESEIKMQLSVTLGQAAQNIKIGSVEKFQGNERTVIIISTVRSSEEALEMGEEYKLGFVRDPNRLNVCVTRSSSLLVVIGCSLALMADPHWAALINYIKQGGGYI